jgi:hypothetical protein
LAIDDPNTVIEVEKSEQVRVECEDEPERLL